MLRILLFTLVIAVQYSNGIEVDFRSGQNNLNYRDLMPNTVEAVGEERLNEAIKTLSDLGYQLAHASTPELAAQIENQQLHQIKNIQNQRQQNTLEARYLKHQQAEEAFRQKMGMPSMSQENLTPEQVRAIVRQKQTQQSQASATGEIRTLSGRKNGAIRNKKPVEEQAATVTGQEQIKTTNLRYGAGAEQQPIVAEQQPVMYNAPIVAQPGPTHQAIQVNYHPSIEQQQPQYMPDFGYVQQYPVVSAPFDPYTQYYYPPQPTPAPVVQSYVPATNKNENLDIYITNINENFNTFNQTSDQSLKSLSSKPSSSAPVPTDLTNAVPQPH